MDIQSIYEKVSRKIQISLPEFFSHYNDTIGELIALYGEALTIGKSARVEADSLTDTMCVFEDYAESIIDNIISLEGSSEDSNYRKTEFIRKSKNAYKRLWSEKARTATLTNRRRWL